MTIDEQILTVASLPEPNASEIEGSDSSQLTDDGIEAEVEHAASQIRWPASKTWLNLKIKGKLSDLEKALGETVWIVPANRDQGISCDTDWNKTFIFM